jgi:hypothetical protein
MREAFIQRNNIEAHRRGSDEIDLVDATQEARAEEFESEEEVEQGEESYDAFDVEDDIIREDRARTAEA